MKFLPFFILLIFYFFMLIPANTTAQMKSCCEPEGTILVSSVKQTPGTLKMITILDSIHKHANPEDFYLMNTARAEMFKKKLATETDPNNRVNLYFKYSNEALNAGKTDEAISVLIQIIAAMKLNAENLTAETKPVFDLLAIAYMRDRKSVV